jgi:hypothetical protein
MTSPTIPDEPRISATPCVRHQFELAFDRCRTCDDTYCIECLIYALGPDQPPYCMNCALVAAGVRKRGARTPKVSRRELRRREKEARAASRRAELSPPPGAEIDWSLPEAATTESEHEAAASWLGDELESADPERIVAF